VIVAFSPKLALLSVALVGVAALVTAALAIAQLRHEREAVRLGGREDGLVLLQFVQGISKLRVSAGETRMFGLWAEIFASAVPHWCAARVMPICAPPSTAAIR
jgi:ATP-binding cassette subfamily C protein